MPKCGSALRWYALIVLAQEFGYVYTLEQYTYLLWCCLANLADNKDELAVLIDLKNI